MTDSDSGHDRAPCAHCASTNTILISETLRVSVHYCVHCGKRFEWRVGDAAPRPLPERTD